MNDINDLALNKANQILINYIYILQIKYVRNDYS